MCGDGRVHQGRRRNPERGRKRDGARSRDYRGWQPRGALRVEHYEMAGYLTAISLAEQIVRIPGHVDTDSGAM
jgi:hypothetical protein